jgi:hypothetical protein
MRPADPTRLPVKPHRFLRNPPIPSFFRLSWTPRTTPVLVRYYPGTATVSKGGNSKCPVLRQSPLLAFIVKLQSLLSIPLSSVHRSPFTDHRSPITVHRSPITVHRSPFTDHRSPITDHRSPFTDHRSPISNLPLSAARLLITITRKISSVKSQSLPDSRALLPEAHLHTAAGPPAVLGFGGGVQMRPRAAAPSLARRDRSTRRVDREEPLVAGANKILLACPC